jgi:hypothetical protein
MKSFVSLPAALDMLTTQGRIDSEIIATGAKKATFMWDKMMLIQSVVYGTDWSTICGI